MEKCETKGHILGKVGHYGQRGYKLQLQRAEQRQESQVL